MDWIETHRDVVYPWQCDHMGHMNVMYYTGMFDRATWHLFGRVGAASEYVRSTRRGWAAVRSEIDYQRELLPGDMVVIRSRFLELGDRKAVFEHEMVDALSGEVAAVNRLVGVHLDLQERRAVPIPEAVRTAIETLMS